jgi:hypothetical protein
MQRLALAAVTLLGLWTGAPAAEPMTLGDKVVAYCEQRKGKQVGSGECAALAEQALAAVGARGRGPDNPNPGDYTWGRLVFVLKGEGNKAVPEGKSEDLQPGDIIQFRNAKWEGKGYSMGFPGHTAIIAGLEDKGQTLKILHQNVNGQRVVVEGTLRLGDIKQGWIRVYRPMPAGGGSGGQVSDELTRLLKEHFDRRRQELSTLLRAALGASEEDLRSALQSSSVEQRFAAAYAVGERRLSWQDDLILLLKDDSDAVRQAARRSLIILGFLKINPEAASVGTSTALAAAGKGTRPPDFGPLPGASRSARAKAAQDWAGWWKEQGEAGPKRSAAQHRDPDADQLSKGLLEATGQRHKELLKRYAEANGAEYTRAIAYAIPRLSGVARKEAREALADRLSIRKATTLLGYLEDEDAEVRRAAALACAMKED